MSKSKTTMVVTAIPNPQAIEEMQTYLSRVVPILKEHGGEIVISGKTKKPVIGELNFGMLLVMNFETEEDIQKSFESLEYKKLIPLRDKGFRKMDVAILSSL
ncbi:MAG: DUF1330 domain-containing protein [SAR324 cluster bacterium]|nr:DUF1330 domain-containing protein [SAR324 cluster bacterium]